MLQSQCHLFTVIVSHVKVKVPCVTLTKFGIDLFRTIVSRKILLHDCDVNRKLTVTDFLNVLKPNRTEAKIIGILWPAVSQLLKRLLLIIYLLASTC